MNEDPRSGSTPQEPVSPVDLVIDPEQVGLFNQPDYFALLSRLRSEAPVFRYAPNSWTIAGYDDIRTVSRDPQRFRSGDGVLMNDPKREGAELPGSILHMDPPEHAAWRKTASRWFTPRAVGRLEDGVRSITRGVLDRYSAGDAIDIVDAIAAPIPVLVIADLLGIGSADTADLRRWSDACVEGPDENPDSEAEVLSNMANVGELLAFLTEQVVERRTNPRGDLLTELVEAEVDGRGFRDDEVVMYCLSILVAGNETTRHLLSGSVNALFEHPEQRQALIGADPETIGTAVEECLRWVTPIQTFARTATTEVELGGHTIAEGDWVVLMYASANRDEQVFGSDASQFDTARPVKTANLAFGFGEHLCLGAAIARLEARVFLEEFLTRFGDYSITGSPTWVRSTLVRGYTSLPAVL